MDEIRVETKGAVRTITLNRPEKRNALTPAMVEELTRLFSVQPPDSERVTLLRAEGKTFSAGMDLKERLENGWPVESPLVRLCNAVRTYALPVMVAMQGDAVAGGAMLVLHCDLVVAMEGAHFAMTLAQIGIAPPWIVTSRIADRVGPALAREMLYLGDFVPVARLAQHNAINAAVSREEFPYVVERYLKRLSQNAPLSLKCVKQHLVKVSDQSSTEPLPEEERWTRLALDSADAREGQQARLEHREPRFQGK